MTPMGNHVGSGRSRQKQLWLLLVTFVLFFRAIISRKIAEYLAMRRILDADDQQIINFM